MSDTDKLLKIREERIQAVLDNIDETQLASILLTYAKGVTSRKYKEIVMEAGVIQQVIWGCGGAQTTRQRQYEVNNTPYIHIPSSLLK